MRAIILAAGEGRRLRPLTDGIPKCLVRFQGRRILDHALDQLRACGVNEITLVTGYRSETLAELGLPTRHNPDFATTNMVHSLFCAEDRLEGDVIVAYGDILFGRSQLRALIDSPASIAVTVDLRWRELWSLRMEDPLADAETLKLDSTGKIVELGRKPRTYRDIEGQYMGLIRFSAEATPRVVDFYRELRERTADPHVFRNLYMTDFLQSLIDAGIPVQAVPVEGGWLEIDTLDDLRAYEKAGITLEHIR